jgi:uncharacterized membrane protein YjjB (DUF3815 family)
VIRRDLGELAGIEGQDPRDFGVIATITGRGREVGEENGWVAGGEAAKPEAVLDLVARLAGALVAGSYEGTLLAEQRVRDVAAAYGQKAEVVVLPESAVVTVDGKTRVLTGVPVVPELRQVSELKVWEAEVGQGRLSVAEADRRLRGIIGSPTLYQWPWRVAGTVLFSVGFGISIQATGQEVLFSALLGAVVGVIMVVSEVRVRLRWIAPLVASTVVAAAALLAAKHGWITGGPIPLMLPALFVFIPGDAITMSMVELSAGRLTAGAARMTQSLAALGVLAFGPVIALALLNIPSSALTDTAAPATLGLLAGWFGWVIFTVGVMLVFQMRARDMPWALVVVLFTYAAQLAGVRAFGDLAGTALASMLMIVLCVLLARTRRGPPVFVLYLAAFFVLTPGSHGLRGLDSWIGGHPIHAIQELTDMFELLAAIALGILAGASIAPLEKHGPSVRRTGVTAMDHNGPAQ